MKIRLAKKIMKHRPEILYGMKLLKKYWGEKMMEYECLDHKDHRITKAMNLSAKCKARDILHSIEKNGCRTPFMLKDMKACRRKLESYKV